MKSSVIILIFLITLLCPSLMVVGCKKNALSPQSDTTNTNKPILKLPEREAKVYIGIADRWHEMDDPNNYGKWNYVRENAAGFYTNFIVMWKNSYQNSEDPQKSCDDMRKAFLKNGCFFETSMETAVNAEANGGNNETTDKKYIDLLTNAGFIVDNTSLNYGVSAQRINTLKTYKGQRSCLTLAGPWMLGGDIQNDAVKDNKQIRDNILITDGMQTDGPLGYWYNNSGSMREGSYSLVKLVEKSNKISAVMLAPYDVNVAGYNQKDDFFTVSKQCVFGHEDNNASPDMWTIWTYGQHEDQPTFPESNVNSSGETEPANTLMGVGYWLIKHLNNFPKLEVIEKGAVNSNVTVNVTNGNKAEVTISKASNGSVEYKMPIIISNEAEPQIEISPVIHATISGGNKDWDISFDKAGTDVTDEIIYKGGLNCINFLRLTKANKLKLKMNIKSKNFNSTSLPSPVTIKIETMSNLSNTKNSKVSYTVIIKAK